MVPNPTSQHIEPAQLGRRQIRGTLQRYCQKPIAIENELNSRPVSRFNQSISVEELNVLTRKMNIKTRMAQAPLLRSHSAPIESNPVTRIVTETHKAYRSYASQSSASESSGSSISTSSSLPPPSRYHHTKKFKRRVTFNESVQVFELPTPPPSVTSNDEEAKQKPALPYTKTRMKVKKDTIKFEEIKQIKKPSKRRLQSRMTSYVRDKLKAN